MVATITVQDETTFGAVTREWVVSFFTEQITVRELISRRVQQEVERYNSEKPDYFSGLIQPSNADVTLKGFRLRHKRPIDWQQQVAEAEKAFLSNGFLLLAGSRQLMELDEVLEIRPDTAVSFLKLVPLVGG